MSTPTLFDAVCGFLGPLHADLCRLIDEGSPDDPVTITICGYEHRTTLKAIKDLDAAHMAAHDATGTGPLMLDRAHEDILRYSIAAEREACAKVAEQKEKDFLSPEYATGQPLSSLSERFACQQVARAIRNRTATDKGE